MKIEEVANYLRVDVQTVRNYVKAGKFPIVNMSAKEKRIKRIDLKKFIDESIKEGC
jgi:excisionase family DNA binding protein